jgi:PAN domain
MILERSKKEMVSLAAIAVLFFVSIALVEAFALEPNTDRPGMDYSNFDLASANPSLCEQACNGDPNCLAFTYVKPGVQGAVPGAG